MSRTAKKAPPPFFSDGAASDPTYVSVRDDPNRISERRHVERLWERFRDYTGDEHALVLADARANFRQRLWEMHLASLLLDHGQVLQRPKGDEPDIKLALGAKTVWIEAVAVERGTGPDAVEEPEPMQLVFLRHEPMMLRYTNAFRDKLAQCQERKSKGIVAADHAYVVAVNSSALPFSDIELGCPDIVRMLWGMGDPQYVVPIPALGGSGPIRTEVPHRAEIAKRSGSTVSTTFFLDAQAADISAVLFTFKHPLTDEFDGDDILVVHNSFATVPLLPGTFRFGREWWQEQRYYGWRDIPRWTRRTGLKWIAQRCMRFVRHLAASRRPKQHRIDEFKAEMEKLNGK